MVFTILLLIGVPVFICQCFLTLGTFIGVIILAILLMLLFWVLIKFVFRTIYRVVSYFCRLYRTWVFSCRLRKKAEEDDLETRDVDAQVRVTPCCGKYVAERMVDGSDLKDWVQPAFQCSVFTTSRAGQPIRMGEAFRVVVKELRGKGTKSINVLATAAHVIQNAVDGKLFLVKDILNSGKVERKTLEVKLEDFKVVETEDVAFLRLSDHDLSTFPIKGCKLTEIVLSTTQIANVGGANKGSLGSVGPFEKAFGMVTFDGSTVRGTSGAPYYMNNAVYGLHVGCMSNNVGYSAPYVLAMARNEFFARKEDTDQYLMEQCVKKGRKFRFKSVGVSDLWTVELAGRVYTVEEDFLNEMLEGGGKGENARYEPKYVPENLDIAPREIVGAPKGFTGYSDSGNFIGAETIVHVSAPGSSGQIPSISIKRSTPEEVNAVHPDTQKRTLTKMSGSQAIGQQTRLENQELTRVQQDRASDDTSKLIDELTKGLANCNQEVMDLSNSAKKKIRFVASLLKASGPLNAES